MDGKYTVWAFQNAQKHPKRTPDDKDTQDLVEDADLKSVDENKHKHTRMDGGNSATKNKRSSGQELDKTHQILD